MSDGTDLAGMARNFMEPVAKYLGEPPVLRNALDEMYAALAAEEEEQDKFAAEMLDALNEMEQQAAWDEGEVNRDARF